MDGVGRLVGRGSLSSPPSSLDARGHEKRGCRWRARINQTGVKINCKTLASRVPFPSSPPLLPIHLRRFPPLAPPLSWLSCVTREPSHLPLCPHPPPLLPCLPPSLPLARSFRVRSLFLRARVPRERRRRAGVCVRGERMCIRAPPCIRSSEMERQSRQSEKKFLCAAEG